MNKEQLRIARFNEKLTRERKRKSERLHPVDDLPGVELNRKAKGLSSEAQKHFKKIMEEAEKNQPTKDFGPVSISDADLVPLKEILDEKDKKIVPIIFTDEMIKKMQSEQLVTLIREKRRELKKLRMELLSRMI
jgi:succinate dehydrogenase flavin-adding protein (antitoxin of CptAB toxin-antitoxin module)